MESVGTHSRSLPVFEALEPRLLLSGNVLITEFMASNGATLLDGDGESSDWIEIHNPTDAPVTLDGWYLTDKSGNLDKWQFPDATPDPDITIAPGGYMVVFASGQDDEDYPYHDGTYYHTNFKLSPDDGDEDVVLVEDDGTTIAHAYYDYPEQFKDISYGIYLGSAWWDTLVGEGAPLSYHVPTPGDTGLLPAGGEEGWTAIDFDDSTWTDATVFGAAGIVITEINTGDPNFVEIQNVSIGSVNTTGWTVLVNNGPAGINSVNSAGWQLPGSIASEQILFRSDDPADGA
ncbi:MAG: lamin tail domain-containing protein, partial [Planctomycetes bacterium]|nr:lamin tail domain-containing protein [Planctomycetota bacterium]